MIEFIPGQDNKQPPAAPTAQAEQIESVGQAAEKWFEQTDAALAAEVASVHIEPALRREKEMERVYLGYIKGMLDNWHTISDEGDRAVTMTPSGHVLEAHIDEAEGGGKQTSAIAFMRAYAEDPENAHREMESSLREAVKKLGLRLVAYGSSITPPLHFVLPESKQVVYAAGYLHWCDTLASSYGTPIKNRRQNIVHTIATSAVQGVRVFGGVVLDDFRYPGCIPIKPQTSKSQESTEYPSDTNPTLAKPHAKRQFTQDELRVALHPGAQAAIASVKAASATYKKSYETSPLAIDNLPMDEVYSLFKDQGSGAIAVSAGVSGNRRFVAFNTGLRQSEVAALDRQIDREGNDVKKTFKPDPRGHARALKRDPAQPNRSPYFGKLGLDLRTEPSKAVTALGIGGTSILSSLHENASLVPNPVTAIAATIGGLVVGHVYAMKKRRGGLVKGYSDADLDQRTAAVESKLKTEQDPNTLHVPDDAIDVALSRDQLDAMGYYRAAGKEPVKGFTVEEDIHGGGNAWIRVKPGTMYLSLLLKQGGAAKAKNAWLERLHGYAVESKLIAEQHASLKEEIEAIRGLSKHTQIADPNESVVGKRLDDLGMEMVKQAVSVLLEAERIEHETRVQAALSWAVHDAAEPFISLEPLRALAERSLLELPAGSEESYRLTQEVGAYFRGCAARVKTHGDFILAFQGFSKRFGQRLGFQGLADVQGVDNSGEESFKT